MEVGNFRKTNKGEDELLFFGYLWPMTCQTMLYKVHCKVLRRLAQTTTKLIVLQDLCYLGFLSLWTQKKKAYLECIMPFRILHLKSTWQCSSFGFFCLLKHGCLASIYSLHFCYAFLLCLFLLYTIVHLISVFDFLGGQFCDIAKVAIIHQTI